MFQGNKNLFVFIFQHSYTFRVICIILVFHVHVLVYLHKFSDTVLINACMVCYVNAPLLQLHF